MSRIKVVLSAASVFLVLPLFTGCQDNPAPSTSSSAASASGGSSAVATPAPAAGTYNHDMSAYKKLAQDALEKAKEDKLAEAHPITMQLEKVWDKGTDDMMKADTKLHTEIDDQMDAAIKATNPSEGGTKEKSVEELQKFIDMLDKVPAK